MPTTLLVRVGYPNANPRTGLPALMDGFCARSLIDIEIRLVQLRCIPRSVVGVGLDLVVRENPDYETRRRFPCSGPVGV